MKLKGFCCSMRRLCDNLTLLIVESVYFLPNQGSKSGKDQCEKCVTSLIHERIFNRRVFRCEKQADGGLFDSISRCRLHAYVFRCENTVSNLFYPLYLSGDKGIFSNTFQCTHNTFLTRFSPHQQTKVSVGKKLSL